MLDGSSPRLLSPSDVPLTSEPRNVTCLRIVAPNRLEMFAAQSSWRTPCDKEFFLDDALRSELSLRFTHTITIPANEFARSGGSDALASLRARVLGPLRQQQSVFVHEPMIVALEAFSRRPFRLCMLPRESAGVLRMASELEQRISFEPSSTLCLHWRGEDFHHPTQILRYRQNTSSPALVAARALQVAKRHSSRVVLVLTNARYEAMHSLLEALRSAGLVAHSARMLEGTGFGCRSRFVYGVFAEMHVCSRAISFLGSRKSQFSAHILAMREARGAAMGAARNRTAHWL